MRCIGAIVTFWIGAVLLLGCDRGERARETGPSGAYPAVPAPAPRPPATRPVGVVRYLALGDSYTIGEGVEPAARWPVHLAARVREQGRTVEEPWIIAATGWTSGDLLAAIDAAEPLGAVDYVSVMVGVNDQFQRRSIDAYREQLTTLVRRAIACAGGDERRVVVMSIPDWSATRMGRSMSGAADTGGGAAGGTSVSADIDRFNAVCRNVADAAHVSFVDVTSLSRSVTDDAGSLLAPDGLHYADPMHRQWADLAWAALLSRQTQPAR
ncbi:MAG TPA: SGNH/GDSL hydrolase family protein [Tepidisphaeraceae bacterium]|jgi:lysophospholipase L1-like esterase|nr:SGNH/GDSL hydrolase family protein [Tepidisphaeraceae bacterium]